MIDQRIVAYAKEFVGVFNEEYTYLPSMRLDQSWLSLSAIDIHFANNKDILNTEESIKKFILGVSSYLGGIAYDIWSNFPDTLDVELKIVGVEYPEIVLVARGGKFLEKGEEVKINITKGLSEVLFLSPKGIKTFRDYTTENNPLLQKIPLFGLGLFSALSPFIEGGWNRVPLEEIKIYAKAAESYLSVGMSKRLKEIAPYLDISSNPSVFLQGLIFPPTGYAEPLSYVLGVKHLLVFLKDNNQSNNDIFDLALALSKFSDDRISSIGICIASALVQDKIPLQLSASISAKDPYAFLLRPGYLVAKQILNLEKDFVEHYVRGELERSKKIFEIERQLGFLPLVNYPATFLDKKFSEIFLNCIAWSRPEEALEVSKEDGVTSPEMLLMCAYIEIATGQLSNFEKRAELINDLGDRLRPHVDELFASLALRRGMINEAKEQYQKIFDTVLKGSHSDQKLRLGTLLASIYCDLNDVEGANLIYERIEGISSRSFKIMLLKLRISMMKEDGRGEAKRIISEISELIDCHPLVIVNKSSLE